MAEKKPRWADMTDEDWDPPAVSVTKHGVKVKKSVAPAPYVPPHRTDKNQPPSKTKDGDM